MAIAQDATSRPVLHSELPVFAWSVPVGLVGADVAGIAAPYFQFCAPKNRTLQPRRLPLCSTVGAECHHAVEVDTVGLGFYGSQPVPGVYEREASATHP